MSRLYTTMWCFGIDDRIVLPLEWVDGHSLKGLLDDKELAATVPVKKVLLDLCSVLSFLHAHCVIHRDLRPDNVIVCSDGSLELLNFDCAHLGGQDLGTIATRVGRHLDERCVAPEVFTNPANASSCSDIYSLGMLPRFEFTPFPRSIPFPRTGFVCSGQGNRLDTLPPAPAAPPCPHLPRRI